MYINPDGGLLPNGNYRNTQVRVNRFVRYNGDPTNPNTISNTYPVVDTTTSTTADSTTTDESTASSTTDSQKLYL